MSCVVINASAAQTATQGIKTAYMRMAMGSSWSSVLAMLPSSNYVTSTKLQGKDAAS
jgi:hypothetical protein